jgi:hypothetical protein
MASAYSDLKTLIYITAIGGGLCMMWCAYLVWRRSEATQAEYLQFWGATLLVLVVTCILLFLFVRAMSNTYETARAQLPLIGGCITNSQWKKLPTAMYTATDMTGERQWAQGWLAIGVVLVAAMVYLMVKVSQALDQLNRPQPDMY